VIRDGIYVNVPTKKIVPGDIIEIKKWDKIPADIRIF